MIKIYNNGSKWYYCENGLLHRANGLPAIEFIDGSKGYYENGKYHRANGLPAVEYADGSKGYYENGIEYIPNKEESNLP